MRMYGYEKVIVVELKREWDLVMRPGGEIIRIHKKEGLHVGDVIYILPEDILGATKDNTILFCPAGQQSTASTPEPPKPKKKSSHQAKILMRQLASVAAIFAICFSILLFSKHMPVQVYAVASFDATQGLQVELDQNSRILSVTSVDGSIPESMLATLKGRQLQDVESELRYLIGDGPCLLGYAPQQGEADPWMELQLRELLSDRGVLLLTGTAEDIPAAKEKELSLGQYIAGHQLHSPDTDMLDDLDGMDASELEQMISLLKSTPHWEEKEDFREAVEELQEQWAEQQEDVETDQDDEEEPELEDSPEEDDDDTPSQESIAPSVTESDESETSSAASQPSESDEEENREEEDSSDTTVPEKPTSADSAPMEPVPDEEEPDD